MTATSFRSTVVCRLRRLTCGAFARKERVLLMLLCMFLAANGVKLDLFQWAARGAADVVLVRSGQNLQGRGGAGLATWRARY